MKYEDLYDKLLNLNESITGDQLFDEYFKESNDPDIPDGIESTVKILESKGYAVKYSSPGHLNTRFDNDRNKFIIYTENGEA